MQHHFLAAQIIGTVALLISLSVFQINDRRKMLRVGALSAVFWTIHFSLLGAATGAAMNAVGGVRDLTLSRTKPRASNLWILGLIMLLAVAATALTWAGPISLLPLTACGLSGLAYWTTKTQTIRRLYLLVPPLWLAYNIVAHSYPGIAIECLIIVSNLIGQFRFDFWPKLLRVQRVH